MNLFSIAFLVVGERAENGRENLAGAVNPGHGLVKANGAFGGSTGNAGGPDGIVCGDEIEIAGDGPQDQVRGAIGIAGVLPARSEGGHDSSD